MIKFKPISDKNTMLKVKKLYLEAFPDFERLPFWLLRYKSKKKNSSLYVIYNDDEFVGMTNLAYYKDIIWRLILQSNLRDMEVRFLIIWWILTRIKGFF